MGLDDLSSMLNVSYHAMGFSRARFSVNLARRSCRRRRGKRYPSAKFSQILKQREHTLVLTDQAQNRRCARHLRRGGHCRGAHAISLAATPSLHAPPTHTWNRWARSIAVGDRTTTQFRDAFRGQLFSSRYIDDAKDDRRFFAVSKHL